MSIALIYKMKQTSNMPENSQSKDIQTTDKPAECKLCALAQLNACVCVELKRGFSPSNSAETVFKGLIANNPNNPGISIKEGSLSFSHIESIPLAEVGKAKLCQRNQFMLINTIQIYNSQSNAKPVCFGVDQNEACLWLLGIIQAKLIIAFQINIGNERPQQETVSGVLFKRSVLGKWKRHQATCATLPPNRCLRLSDEYTSLGSTSEIWTRFQRVEVQEIGCLVVKMWGAMGKKEIAVPLSQLSLWMRALCSLLA